MIRKVTFYWLLLTLVLIDSWLLSKPNILGKIGLLIYKYHYLRSFPRTLLTVWVVVSTSALIVLAVQFLIKKQRLSRTFGTVLLSAGAILSVLGFAQVYFDFTSWSYSHTGLKFRYGAYMLPVIVTVVFVNGLVALLMDKGSPVLQSQHGSSEELAPQHPATIKHGTSLP